MISALYALNLSPQWRFPERAQGVESVSQADLQLGALYKALSMSEREHVTVERRQCQLATGSGGAHRRVRTPRRGRASTRSASAVIAGGRVGCAAPNDWATRPRRALPSDWTSTSTRGPPTTWTSRGNATAASIARCSAQS